jgi:tRNA (cytidine56-2'-O)-methyltransferase
MIKMISVLVLGKSSYDSCIDICMISRAFGASNITFFPSKGSAIEAKLKRSIKQANKKWGGNFSVYFCNNWEKFIKEKRNYLKIYLTRYGMPIIKMRYRISTYKNILLITSFSESIKAAYDAADFNISISSQPHTCGSSIAIFLHDFYQGRELAMRFENPKYKVVPSQHGVEIKPNKSN